MITDPRRLQKCHTLLSLNITPLTGFISSVVSSVVLVIIIVTNISFIVGINIAFSVSDEDARMRRYLMMMVAKQPAPCPEALLPRERGLRLQPPN